MSDKSDLLHAIGHPRIDADVYVIPLIITLTDMEIAQQADVEQVLALILNKIENIFLQRIKTARNSHEATSGQPE